MMIDQYTEEMFLKEVKRYLIDGLSKPFCRTRWMWHCEEQEVYLRIGPKIIDGAIVNFIQIANIRTDEENQKKGKFTQFLKWFEQFKTGIYVENAHNPILPPFLLKNGFKNNTTMGHEYDYYKLAI